MPNKYNPTPEEIERVCKQIREDRANVQTKNEYGPVQLKYRVKPRYRLLKANGKQL